MIQFSAGLIFAGWTWLLVWIVSGLPENVSGYPTIQMAVIAMLGWVFVIMIWVGIATIGLSYEKKASV